MCPPLSGNVLRIVKKAVETTATESHVERMVRSSLQKDLLRCGKTEQLKSIAIKSKTRGHSYVVIASHS